MEKYDTKTSRYISELEGRVLNFRVADTDHSHSTAFSIEGKRHKWIIGEFHSLSTPLPCAES